MRRDVPGRRSRLQQLCCVVNHKNVPPMNGTPTSAYDRRALFPPEFLAPMAIPLTSDVDPLTRRGGRSSGLSAFPSVALIRLTICCSFSLQSTS